MSKSNDEAFDYVVAVYAASEAYAFGTREADLVHAVVQLEREAPDHRLVAALREKLARTRVIGGLLADSNSSKIGNVVRDIGEA